MHTINVEKLTQDDFNKLVNNAKVVFPDQSLNQVRHHVARMFGAKNWKSLSAAVVKHTEVHEESQSFYVLTRSYFGEEPFTENYSGKTMAEMYQHAYDGFVKDCFNSLLDDYSWYTDELEYIESFRSISSDIDHSLLEIDSVKDIENRLRLWVINNPDEQFMGDDLDKLLGPEFAVLFYKAMFDDEETILIEKIS